MSLREEFAQLALQEGANMTALCQQFGISRQTGYRLLRRYRNEGQKGLADRSRRPRRSPRRTAPEMESLVLALRKRHPAWGGRKLAARLRALGHTPVPAPSTITEILRRAGQLDPARAGQPRAFQRFEHDAPNRLWQMDFKGHVPCGDGRCHPLTVLDDHSRYSLVLKACGDERTATVKAGLTSAFERYGLPEAMVMDNGSPWGDTPEHPYTPLTVWLLRLGIRVSHSRPHHPQTLGKDERFHRTLKRELLGSVPLHNLSEGQRHFDRWRYVYNHERPHEALGDAVPASRYRPSPRPFPQTLPPIEYPATDLVRKVQHGGWTSFLGKEFRLPKAFRGYPVAFRPVDSDGRWEVYFSQQRIAAIDLRGTS